MPNPNDPLSRLALLASQNPGENPASPMALGWETDPLAAGSPAPTVSAGAMQSPTGSPRTNDPLLTLMIARAQLPLRRRRRAPPLTPPATGQGLSGALS